MNLFIVPSWYPSGSNPSYGIFIKEQVGMMANLRPDWNIGVSTWGQGNSEKLIWAKDHFKNIRKLSHHGYDRAYVSALNGFTEYYQPALSWTKKFRKGNLREIIRCNELNYQAHVLASGKPDFIIVQACYPGILIADYLSEKYDVPVHLHIRLGGFMFEKMLDELGSMKKDLLRAISKARLVTVTSDFHGKEVKKWVSNTRILYNPVDTAFFQMEKEHENFALCIGRLEPEKGVDLLLDAATEVPDLKIKLIGSGSQEHALKMQISSMRLGDKIEMVGEQDRMEVRILMQKCQFLILPSKYETFGNVLVEAMSCGKPVVATKCGGPNEIVQPQTGFLAAIDSNDLSAKIARMMNESTSFNAKEIRSIAENNFSPHIWIHNLQQLLKEI